MFPVDSPGMIDRLIVIVSAVRKEHGSFGVGWASSHLPLPHQAVVWASSLLLPVPPTYYWRILCSYYLEYLANVCMTFAEPSSFIKSKV